MPLVQGKKADKLHNWWETGLSKVKGKAAREALEERDFIKSESDKRSLEERRENARRMDRIQEQIEELQKIRSTLDNTPTGSYYSQPSGWKGKERSNGTEDDEITFAPTEISGYYHPRAVQSWPLASSTIPVESISSPTTTDYHILPRHKESVGSSNMANDGAPSSKSGPASPSRFSPISTVFPQPEVPPAVISSRKTIVMWSIPQLSNTTQNSEIRPIWNGDLRPQETRQLLATTYQTENNPQARHDNSLKSPPVKSSRNLISRLRARFSRKTSLVTSSNINSSGAERGSTAQIPYEYASERVQELDSRAMYELATYENAVELESPSVVSRTNKFGSNLEPPQSSNIPAPSGTQPTLNTRIERAAIMTSWSPTHSIPNTRINRAVTRDSCHRAPTEITSRNGHSQVIRADRKTTVKDQETKPNIDGELPEPMPS